jgi:hypothetical protein
MTDARRAAMHRYEVERALRTAQHIAVGEIDDPHEAIRQLSRAVAALAQAIEDVLVEHERDVSPV